MVGGGAGEVLAVVLIGTGFVLATGLVFLEVGLSEDREREREREQARERELRERDRRRGVLGQRGGTPRLKRPRLGRSRGHRRRLG